MKTLKKIGAALKCVGKETALGVATIVAALTVDLGLVTGATLIVALPLIGRNMKNKAIQTFTESDEYSKFEDQKQEYLQILNAKYESGLISKSEFENEDKHIGSTDYVCEYINNNSLEYAKILKTAKACSIAGPAVGFPVEFFGVAGALNLAHDNDPVIQRLIDKMEDSVGTYKAELENIDDEEFEKTKEKYLKLSEKRTTKEKDM